MTSCPSDPAVTLPFRLLGAVAADVDRLGAAAGPGGLRSPSGLLSESAWMATLKQAGLPAADVPDPDRVRDRDFARWVHAEAKRLASRLERLLGPDIEATLCGQLQAVIASLWADADWARERIDGRFDDPA